MRMFEDKRRVDVLQCVHQMRKERAGAVQTRDQYALIYQVFQLILAKPLEKESWAQLFKVSLA